jgi:DNA-binding transcriptional LysR family regulator
MLNVATDLKRLSVYQYLSTEVHRPYCGSTHALFGKRIEDPRDLARERFVLAGDAEPDELTEFRTTCSLGTRIADVTEHVEEAKHLTMLGRGLCFLPEGHALSDVAAGRLWPLLDAEAAPHVYVFIIENPNASPCDFGLAFRGALLQRSLLMPVEQYVNA